MPRDLAEPGGETLDRAQQPSGTTQRAVAAAVALGARFYERGAEIAVELPAGVALSAEIIAGLDPEALAEHFGLTASAAEAVAWLAEALAVEPVMITDAAECAEVLAQLDGAELIGLDIETMSPDMPREPLRVTKAGKLAALRKKQRDNEPAAATLDPHRSAIGTIQLYAGGDQAWVFSGAARDHLLSGHWLTRQRLVAHNATFETQFLQHFSAFAEAPPVECSMQAVGLLYGKPRSLAAAWRKVYRRTPPKAFGASDWAAPRLSSGQLAYAAADAVEAWALGADMLPKLQRSRSRLAYELQRNAVPAVAAMQLRGLGFDRAEHARQCDKWTSERNAARAQYRALTGEAIPLAADADPTPAQIAAVIEIIASTRQLKAWPRTPSTGALSTARAHLKRLDHAAVEALLILKARAKLLADFGATLAAYVSPATGRLHPSYSIAGALTGRFTCQKPNIQKLPYQRAPEFRKAIIAEPGRVLVAGDWSQIELRAAAEITGCSELRAVYATGGDVHTETAAEIARVEPAAVTGMQRQAAKPVNFGAIYGIGPATLAEDAFDNYGVVMSEIEARDALDRFFDRYPMRAWLRRHAERCQARGFVEVPTSGRIVAASWLPSGRLSFTQICNVPIQGSCADAMLRAVAMLDERLPGALVASVHDELIIEVSETQADAAGHALAEIMVEAFALTFPAAPLRGVVEIGSGRSWADAKAAMVPAG